MKSDVNQMQTEQLQRPTIYNESKEGPTRTGAIRQLMIGVYPLILIGVLLLMISILGITNTFQPSVVNVKPQDHGRNRALNAGYLSSQEESLISE